MATDLFQTAKQVRERAVRMAIDGLLLACTPAECSMLGAIGPCCPRCREIVEPDTAPAQPVQAIAEPAQKLPSGTERLAKNQTLEVNLRHLATNPGAALLAFDEEWAGWVAASAFDEITALKASAVRMRESLAELEKAGTAVSCASGSLRTEYCRLDLALIAARAAMAAHGTADGGA